MSEAKAVMDSIDPDYTEFLALALEFDSPIWSYDPHFLKQKKAKVVNGDYIIRNSTDLPILWEELKEDYFRLLGKKHVHYFDRCLNLISARIPPGPP